MAQNLTPREERILLRLLREFAETRRPVGSRLLSAEGPDALAPATIRLILQRLEALGFLAKTHVSSGRVPTSLAYRYCIEHMADAAISGTSDSAGEEISSLRLGLTELIRSAVGTLSTSAHSLGFATTPSLGEARLKACDLVPVARDSILMVLVLQSGQVYQQWLAPSRCYTSPELRAFSAYLSEAYSGCTFKEIRDSLRKQVAQESAGAPGLINDAVALVEPCFPSGDGLPDVFWEGLPWLLEAPEIHKDARVLRAVLSTLEEKRNLLRFLDEVWDQVHGLTIVIGEDWPDPDSRGLALLGAAYGGVSTGFGFVGVIGPECMRFDRVLPALKAEARRLTEASQLFASQGGANG